MKKIIFIIIAVLLLVPLKSEADNYKMSIGQTKNLHASTTLGTPYAYAWRSLAPEVIRINGPMDQPGCEIEVIGYVSSSPVVVQCTIYYRQYRGKYTYSGSTADDFRIQIYPPKYSIFLDAEGGSVSPNMIEVEYGNKYGILPVPKRYGYTFDGWYTDGGKYVNENTKLVKNSDHTLYAYWKQSIPKPTNTLTPEANSIPESETTFEFQDDTGNNSETDLETIHSEEITDIKPEPTYESENDAMSEFQDELEYHDTDGSFESEEQRTENSSSIEDHEQIGFNISTGDIVSFGTYPKYSDGSMGAIDWIVLDIMDENVLLISEHTIEIGKFDDNWGQMLEPELQKPTPNWAECTLREWLNEEFLYDAFTTEERALIETSWIDNGYTQSRERERFCEDTYDKVFLLSYDEADYYFPTDEERIATPTDYVKAMYKDEVGEVGLQWWWLRSRDSQGNGASKNMDAMTEVYHDGSYICDYVNFKSGIRPAIVVRRN